MTIATQLSLRNISRRYGEQRQWFAIKEASLEIESGEFVAIIGPSGSGKSTLLNILGLLDNAWEGTYEINGVNVDTFSRTDRDMFRSRMFGFVFQSSYANPYESARRNAALGPAIQGESLQTQSQLVSDALETVGLGEKGESLARNLSGGERQRLAIARAIATKPRILLADEPTGNLDSEAASNVMGLLRELNQRGTTVIVITHDSAVAKYADRILEVEDGVLRAQSQAIAQVLEVSEKSAETASSPVVTTVKTSFWHSLRWWPEHAIRAINNVSSRPLRSATLMAAFAIAMAGMITAAGIGASASQQIAVRLATAALDEVRVSVPVGSNLETRMQSAQTIKHLDHVLNVGIVAPLDALTASTSRFAQFTTVGDTVFPGSTAAVDEAALSLFEVRTHPAQAQELFADPTAGNIALVGRDVAQGLGISEGGIGTEIWVSGRPYSVIGIITDAPRAENLVTSVVVPVRSLPEQPSQLIVRTESGFSASIADAIPLALSPSAPAEISVSTTGDLRSLRVGVAQDLEGLLSSISLALLALAVLSASSAMFLSVQTRIQELALSRALGLSQRGVAAVFIWEGIIVGLAGSVAGLSLGLAASVAVSAVQGWSAVMPWATLAVAPLVGILSGALSALFPALRAARIDPAEGIR
ncbi:hypothetical protein CQ018_09635 [Arthrobacter sp. MYb227]|uniref:ABC transporter ATP-binding protein/permease n=1 Tax=Arthrobacter sp. MYb227 TaxID=1848601 RepID=UPI000CFBFA7D|nr:ABC transporter ATP-binding protein/permease [Arthrobacter sp. MYb227]PQZ93890.1 hypothetical protein CQ018_09635 [Arthrobacter sp. MYb227]